MDHLKGQLGVYLITLKNGQTYIGSSKNLYRRYKEHCKNIGSDRQWKPSALCLACAGLSRGEFEFKVLSICCEKDLLSQEEFYISQLSPTLNIVLTDLSRPSRTASVRKKISEKTKITRSCHEYKEAQSRKSKQFWADHRDVMVEGLKKRSTEQYSKTHSLIRKASFLDAGYVAAHKQGLKNFWAATDDATVRRQQELKKAIADRGRSTSRKVLCISNGKEFPSVVAAASYANRRTSTMQAAIKNNWKCAGLLFCFLS